MITIALAPVLPEKLPAPHPGSMAVMLSLIADPENGRVSFQGDPQPLGQGAIKGADGPSALPHATAAGEQMIAAEIVESRAPIRRIRSELVQNSSGAGQFRGGLGALIEYEALGEGQGVIVFDKTKASPTLGVAGGKGPRYENHCIYYPGTDRERLVGKESDLALKPGDRYIGKTAGGGGYGDPLDRELSAVARDVKFEYITPDVALEDYGVVFTADGELDEEATAKERSDRRARR
jgi:N-methylhydantoinase B